MLSLKMREWCRHDSHVALLLRSCLCRIDQRCRDECTATVSQAQCTYCRRIWQCIKRRAGATPNCLLTYSSIMTKPAPHWRTSARRLGWLAGGAMLYVFAAISHALAVSHRGFAHMVPIEVRLGLWRDVEGLQTSLTLSNFKKLAPLVKLRQNLPLLWRGSRNCARIAPHLLTLLQ